MKSILEIESIWEDDDLFEVKVYASNQLFSGTANCYSTREEIRKFGDLLEGFPKTTDQEVEFSTYGSDDFSYFQIHFKCRDKVGHILAKIKIAHIETYSNSPKEEYIAEFDLDIEPNGIDIFSKSIKRLSKANIGEIKAILKN